MGDGAIRLAVLAIFRFSRLQRTGKLFSRLDSVTVTWMAQLFGEAVNLRLTAGFE